MRSFNNGLAIAFIAATIVILLSFLGEKEVIGDVSYLSNAANGNIIGKDATAYRESMSVAMRVTMGGDIDEAANIDALRKLAPLPETEAMLSEIASELNVDTKHLFTGPAGTEAQLRALHSLDKLKDYRTIAFATHALIAGEFDLKEPALVMTPPANDNDIDHTNDGLLLASEVVELKFDADWILLTACNTAAADGTLGAEPLSGLAKSFFYAGTRSLLVSHWPAEASTATRIVPALIKQSEAGIPRAKALQQIMREIRHDQGTDTINTRYLAHPALWATFTIVGEAG